MRTVGVEYASIGNGAGFAGDALAGKLAVSNVLKEVRDANS